MPDTTEERQKRAERLARSLKKKKRPSVSSNRSKGKIAPGRKKTKGKLLPSPLYTARQQAMNQIRKAAQIGDMRKAQDLFFAWVRQATIIHPMDDWTDLFECELDWLRSEIGSYIGRR